MIKLDKKLIGIGFWIGGLVISIINIIKNYTHVSILPYDYIMVGIAIIYIILSLILVRKMIKSGNIDKKDKYAFGIGFWIGGGVYSLINLIMLLKNAPQNNILFYNYLITSVAVIGLILNIILLKKNKNKGMD
jgi:hypothetical protein